MRTIEYASAFKRDYKKIKANPRHRDIDLLLPLILKLLLDDLPLPQKNHDHSLTNNWKDFRECHIKPDLLLIYQKMDNTLRLARLGSHSELGL